MTAATSRLRVLANNLNDSDSATITYSSQYSASFPASYARDTVRSHYWKQGGYFNVTSSTLNIYINDGTNRTALITTTSYATGALLAAAVQSALNSVSSSWTCTYSTTTGKFTIARTSGTCVLRLTQTTNAGWDLLGFVGTTDRSGSASSFPADEVRMHSSEWYQIDLLSPQSVTSFAMICPIDEILEMSSGATVKLKAADVDGNWDSPALSITLTPQSGGVFGFIDDQTTYTYRYWRIEWIDRTNIGTAALKVSHIYIGDHETFTSTGLASGFSKQVVDQSKPTYSDDGSVFWRTLPKYRVVGNAEVQLLTQTERNSIEAVLDRLGTVSACYLALDPTLAVTPDYSDSVIFGRFTQRPSMQHVFRSYYSMQFEFREAV